MLKLGADINFKDEFGDCALTVAADNGRLDVVKFLAEQGADLLITDEDGKTAFQIATDRNFQDIRDFLREKDAAQ
jgi:ankyrin repeat protein